MVPAQQRFNAHDPARAQLDLRLVVQLELVAVDRAAQLFRDNDALLHLPIEIGAVKPVAIATILLGAIEREIGLDHHLVGTRWHRDCNRAMPMLAEM